MQNEWSGTSYHDVQPIPLTGVHDSYKIGYQPIPIKAKIHGAELIAKEKIYINWDDSNFDNYFYDDNDDSRNACDDTASKSPARSVSIPKYTVVYSTGAGISSLRNSVDKPEVDLQKKPVTGELNRVASRPPLQQTNEIVAQECTNVPRSMGPRQFSHKAAPVADAPKADSVFEKNYMQSTVPSGSFSRDGCVDSMTIIPSESEYRPEVFPKERHCLSRGSRSNSSCADTQRSTSPNKQEPQGIYQPSPFLSEYPVRKPSIPNQTQLSGSPIASYREVRPSVTEHAYPRSSAGATQRPCLVAPSSPPHPTHAAVAIPTSISQQSHGQSTTNVQVPKQAYITAFRNSLSNNIPLTNDQPSSSRSPQRIFSREKKSGAPEPLTTTRARVPQPYQPPPQPIPQQYPIDTSAISAYDDQSQMRAISERAPPRRSMAPTTNINAFKLQDAVRQADELHSHMMKQSYTKRSTLDDPYSEQLARAEAILSPKRAAPVAHGGPHNNLSALSIKAEPDLASAMPQIVDINNRIKEAMAVARNALSSQQSDTSARNSVSSPIRGASPTNIAYTSVPAFASPLSPAGRRQAFPISDGIPPSLQLAKKYIDVSGVSRINYERTASPSRGANSNISAEMLSHRIATDPSFRSPTHHYPLSRTSNSRPSVDEMETAKHFASQMAMQQDGKRVPSSTHNLTIKAASPSRGRQYNPFS